MDDDDDINVQFAFDPDDSGALLIWSERPIEQIRLSRADAYALHALLDERFGKRTPPVSKLPRLVAHPSRPHFYLYYAQNDNGMSEILNWQMLGK